MPILKGIALDFICHLHLFQFSCAWIVPENNSLCINIFNIAFGRMTVIYKFTPDQLITFKWCWSSIVANLQKMSSRQINNAFHSNLVILIDTFSTYTSIHLTYQANLLLNCTNLNKALYTCLVKKVS